MNPVIVYSHGFGVRKDDRGLFTAIAAALPGFEHVMFDYNTFDEIANTMTVMSFPDQAQLLEAELKRVRQAYADAQITIIAHSQGSIVTALAELGTIARVVLITPPVELDTDRLIAKFGRREGSNVSLTGVSRLARRDGSTTLVPADYLRA